MPVHVLVRVLFVSLQLTLDSSASRRLCSLRWLHMYSPSLSASQPGLCLGTMSRSSACRLHTRFFNRKNLEFLMLNAGYAYPALVERHVLSPAAVAGADPVISAWSVRVLIMALFRQVKN